MNPQYPQYSQYPQPAKQRRLPVIPKPVLIILLIVVVMGLGLLFQHINGSRAASTINVRYNVATKGATVLLNNKAQAAKSSYRLAPGTYTFRIVKPGYKDFSTTFTAGSNETILLNTRLQLAHAPVINSPSQLTLYPGTTGAQLVDVKYFSGDIWAVATINTATDSNLVVIAQYDPPTNTWLTFLGPGDVFQRSDVFTLPAELQAYLTQTNHLNLGD